MKSERRHELQTNMLADWLGAKIEQIKPYQNAILGGVLLVVVAITGLTIWHKQSVANSEAAWAAIRPSAVNSLDGLAMHYEKVAAEYPNTPAAQWATVLGADQYLMNGSVKLFENKAAAAEDLEKAFKAYKSVVDEPLTPLIGERAAFGLARTLECQGNLTDAVKIYQEVAKRWPNGMFAATATERAEALEKQPTQYFYKRFAMYQPKPQYTAPATDLPGEKDLMAPLQDNPPAQPKTPEKSEPSAKK